MQYNIYCKDKKTLWSKKKVHLIHLINAFQYICIYVVCISNAIAFCFLYEDTE